MQSFDACFCIPSQNWNFGVGSKPKNAYEVDARLLGSNPMIADKHMNFFSTFNELGLANVT